MSKKDIVNKIKFKLKLLDIPKNGCYILKYIEVGNGNRIVWVSPTQVCFSNATSLPNVYRNKRCALYSKNVSLEMLNLIDAVIPYKI